MGSLFGLQRGADLLVYAAIIFLIYMSLLLLWKTEDNRHAITKLVRENAIITSQKTSYSADGVILVRVFNEASVLENTLTSIYNAGFSNILIIDDGSQDTSWEIIQKFSQKHEHIVTLRHFSNRWWGAALETGLEYVRRYLDVWYVVTFDADGQHDIDEIKKFQKAVTKHPELGIVFGSRFFEESNAINMPLGRKIILALWKIFTSFVSGSRLSDPHNGYRIIRKDVVDILKIRSDGMAYASEIIEQVMQKKIPYAEVPVTIIYSDYSLKKWQKNSNALSIWAWFIWDKFFR